MSLSRLTREWLFGLLLDRDEVLKFVGHVAAKSDCGDVAMAVVQELQERIRDWEDLRDQIVVHYVHDEEWWDELRPRMDARELLYDLFASFLLSWCRWDANADARAYALIVGQKVLADALAVGIERKKAMRWARNAMDVMLCTWETWSSEMVNGVIEMSSVIGCETAWWLLKWKHSTAENDEGFLLRLIEGFLSWNARYGWEGEIQGEIRCALDMDYRCKAGQLLHAAGRYVVEGNHVDILEHVLRYVVGEEVKE